MEKVIDLIKSKLETDYVRRITKNDILTLGREFEAFWINENVKSPVINIQIKYESLSDYIPISGDLIRFSSLLDDIRSYMDENKSYFSNDPKFRKSWKR